MTAPVWKYPSSTVSRVVDGDTFLANLATDSGFHLVLTWVQRFRLNRINAAPHSTPEGAQATAFLTSLLVEPFDLESVGPYKFGDEWMAEVTLADGRNVSDLMVSSGHAVTWSGTGPRPGG